MASERVQALPVDPTDEELARDWTLSSADVTEVRRCRGDDKRHSFALQLCMLRRHARFLGDDYTIVPVRIMNHIGRQRAPDSRPHRSVRLRVAHAFKYSTRLMPSGGW